MLNEREGSEILLFWSSIKMKNRAYIFQSDKNKGGIPRIIDSLLNPG